MPTFRTNIQFLSLELEAHHKAHKGQAWLRFPYDFLSICFFCFVFSFQEIHFPPFCTQFFNLTHNIDVRFLCFYTYINLEAGCSGRELGADVIKLSYREKIA